MNAPLQIKCHHCGIRFTAPPGSESAFCCNGCAYVHALIQREGLDRFYDLKQSTPGIPAADRPFKPNDFTWIHEATQPNPHGSHASRSQPGEADPQRPPGGQSEIQNPKSFIVSVRGVSCIGCVWLIEKIFLREPGAIRASVDPARARATFTWHPGELDLAEFAQNLTRFGYTLRPADDPSSSTSTDGSPGARLGICGALALNTMGFTLPRYLGMGTDFFLAGLFDLITLASATLAFLVGGTWFITRAVAALRHRVLHIDLPIAIGIAAAYAASVAGWLLGSERLLYADFVATFTFLMLAGRHLHLVATRKFQNQAADESTLPDSVLPIDPEKPPIAIASLELGTEFQLAPGRALPVAAQLLSPKTATVSLAWMTGEPDPITYRPPTIIPAGAQNLTAASLHLRATEPWSDSLVSTLTSPQSSPQSSSSSSPVLDPATKGSPNPQPALLRRNAPASPRNETVEAAALPIRNPQFLKLYLVAVLAISLLGGTAWLLAAGPLPALEVFIAILVISCPCAIGVAIPLVDQRAASRLQREGVFVKNPDIWSRLRHVHHILFDKTGTVTLERPALINTVTLDSLPVAECTVLASMVARSLHPLSRTLAEELAARGHPISPDPNTVATPGMGLTLAIPQGAEYALTRPPISYQKNHPACLFTRNGETLALFEFDEKPRPGAAETLAELTADGLAPAIISGDAPARVRALGLSLGLPTGSLHGGLSPSAKVDAVRKIGASTSLFLGDGGNDSLAFDAALVTGAPASRDALLGSRADFVFTGRSLDFLPTLFRIARWRTLATRQVITFSILYNAAAIALCLAGKMNPLLAAILMPLSSIVTLLLAARRVS